MLEQFSKVLVDMFGAGFAGAVKAGILLIIAFALAYFVEQIVSLAVMKVNVFRKLENAGEITGFLGSIAYLAVLLLFVPGISSALGASSIADPVISMLRKFWEFLPNVIGAGIVIIIGCQIAKMVRQLIKPLLKNLRIEFLMERLGEGSAHAEKAIDAVSYVAYTAIIVPVFIAALQVLELDSLTRPAVRMLQQIMEFIPNLLASVFIFVIGFVLARIAGRLVKTTIAAAGLDDKVRRFIGENNEFSVSDLIGRMTHVLIVIFFTVEALDVLHMAVLSTIGKSVIAFLPNACGAVVIMLLAWMAAGAVKRVFVDMPYGATALRCAVYAVAGFMVLSQLHIAPYIVNTAFTFLFLSIAIAFGIAVGFGAKDVVTEVLRRKVESCHCTKKEEVSTDKESLRGM